MDPEQLRLALDAAMGGVGLSLHGYVGAAALARATAALPASLRSRYGVDDARGAVVAALPYGEGPAEEPEWARPHAGPRAAIARFARANWYGELGARLSTAAAAVARVAAAAALEPPPAQPWRRLVNSRLPEKRLALLAGLGAIGRNSLLLVRDAGPGCVLGLLLLPLDPTARAAPPVDEGVLEAGASCGSCRACVDACPTGALSGAGGFDRLRCLQHWSVVEGRLPPAIEAAWGGRLYGCDRCLEACPRFRLASDPPTELGRLGAGLPVSWLASVCDEELRSRLRGSALGQGWIPPAALRRNAAIATRNLSRGV